MYIQGINVAKLMVTMMNEVASTTENEWDDNYRHRHLQDTQSDLHAELAMIDFNRLTEPQLQFLGFKKLHKEDRRYLVPLWLFRALPIGTKLVTLMGETVEVGKDPLHNDATEGCVYYYVNYPPLNPFGL